MNREAFSSTWNISQRQIFGMDRLSNIKANISLPAFLMFSLPKRSLHHSITVSWFLPTLSVQWQSGRERNIFSPRFLLLLSPIFLLNEIFWVYSSHGFWVGAGLDRLDILPCLLQTYIISVCLTLRSKLDILSMLREGNHQNVIYMDSKKWG